MCPVHSTDGRRPGHPTGGVPVRSGGRQYARAAAYTMPIITREASTARQYYAGCGYQDARRLTSISCSKYYSRYVPGPACRGSAPLYVPPSAIKGEAHNVTTQAHLDLAQAHKLIQAQYITQWSRVLRSGGSNHSKPLCVLVFVHHLVDKQNA
jgi:hypothetical protein